MIPGVPNATLVDVHAPGASEQYGGQPAARGAQLYAEDPDAPERCYLIESATVERTGQADSVVQTRVLIVDHALDLAWERGATATVRRLDGSTDLFAVRDVKPRQFPGVPGIVRIVLEET